MGEKIKTLGKANIKNQDIEIELNEPTSQNGEQQIHIQTKKFRLELSKNDFITYSLSVLKSAKKLKKLKAIDE